MRIKLITGFLLGIVGGLSVTYCINPSDEDTGFAALISGEKYTRQILILSNENVADDWCGGNENMLPPEYKVADFRTEYIDFFAEQNGNKYSSFIECGVREENICGILYGERNVEGDKGYSRSLWFEVNPKTDLVVPDSFVCMGL